MENGLVNLAAIVGLLVVSIGTIPLILYMGTQRSTERDGSASNRAQADQPEG